MPCCIVHPLLVINSTHEFQGVEGWKLENWLA